MAVELMIAASLTDISEGKNSKGLTTEKLVLMQLAGFASLATGECWPSYRKLAQRCHCDPTTAKAAIKRLEQKGYVVRVYRMKDDFTNDTNLYYLKNLNADDKYSSYPWAMKASNDDNQKPTTNNEPTEKYMVAISPHPRGNIQPPRGNTPPPLEVIHHPPSSNNTPRGGAYDHPETVNETVTETVSKTDIETINEADMSQHAQKHDTANAVDNQPLESDSITDKSFKRFMSLWPAKNRITALDRDRAYSAWQELPTSMDAYSAVIDELERQQKERRSGETPSVLTRWPSPERWLSGKPWLSNDDQLNDHEAPANQKAS